MTKIDIFSGFLGAGKTTLIKKLIKEAYAGEKLVLIENEFGEIGIDGGFMQDAGITVNELNSGCICCSLVGDFGKALEQVIDTYHPDRILIEPSGVGKLSDVIKAVQKVDSDEITLNSFTTVVDAKKVKMYMKNFGEFFNNQVEFAGCIVMSHTDGLDEEKLANALVLLREHNPSCTVITTPWSALDGGQILAAMERRDTLTDELEKLAAEAHDEHHHHHHHDGEECDDPDCECHHHHHDDDDDDDDDDEHEHEHEHEHHHHHHDGEECDDPDCEYHHHHHHHADDVFTSFGVETTVRFNREKLAQILLALQDEERYGVILRAKGIVPASDGSWIHFDYVPGEPDVRVGSASTIGRLCVIGSKLHEDELKALFGV